MNKKFLDGLKTTLITVAVSVILIIFLSPFIFMASTSLKTQGQISIMGGPIWPAAQPKITYNDKEVDVFSVPVAQCEGFDPNSEEVLSLAIVEKGRQESTFVNPDDLGRGEFLCQVSWRALDRPWKFSPTWQNYTDVWELIPNGYPRLLWNTTFYALITMLGTVVSCILVAYGFARFRFPGRDLLFVILISTLFLPFAVTIIPTYAFWQRLGLVGTWWPLIVPHFFANAYNVFLFRQYFMTLPQAIDESAMIDGAGPLRILWSVIVPQSYPVIIAVVVFHIVFAWNDYFGPLIYLSTSIEKWPISVALSSFNGIYGQQPQLIQAGAMLALILPVILFFVAQRFFIQGIVVTGVEK
ncbi:MAG: carbohydrate ABC transporter permease [Anaerolineales bacterium]|nr:carbohydrate ABC transporter permease [Chloroflexota bacterium]MBL6982800.1 carbohydrate ABC transporter permease [Anaerolineales bacterium]